ncbi:MAG: bifunctional hydroxymethylpyrimidine kinase/phosphomethylpyrimidine kinase [Coriobacteriaceae bacterium]|nr:MAG: bifunctional hydroxymethylpyrimidine kinase/phosphomethylpyrimidine kinase [Coriobacteriaceae bacterium]
MKAVLAIAGLDSSGGAGLAQDVATISGMGLHPKVAATAVTAQSLAAVHVVTPLPPELVQQQIRAAFEDLVPSAVKIGMLGTQEIAAVAAKTLRQVGAQNIVVDPVLAATSGTLLLEEDAEEGLFSLFRLATLIMPNVPEAEKLLGHEIASRNGMVAAAAELQRRFGCAVLLKGGHLGLADDCLAEEDGVSWISVPPVAGGSAHGTGCMLSSAIAAGLVADRGTEDAVRQAKLVLACGLQSKTVLPEGAYLGLPRI